MAVCWFSTCTLPGEYGVPFFHINLDTTGERQEIESIELELEKLQGDFLDAMPSVRPVLGIVLSEDRHAIDLDASRFEHSKIDERRAPTVEAGRNSDD